MKPPTQQVQYKKSKRAGSLRPALLGTAGRRKQSFLRRRRSIGVSDSKNVHALVILVGLLRAEHLDGARDGEPLSHQDGNSSREGDNAAKELAAQALEFDFDAVGLFDAIEAKGRPDADNLSC